MSFKKNANVIATLLVRQINAGRKTLGQEPITTKSVKDYISGVTNKMASENKNTEMQSLDAGVMETPSGIKFERL